MHDLTYTNTMIHVKFDIVFCLFIKPKATFYDWRVNYNIQISRTYLIIFSSANKKKRDQYKSKYKTIVHTLLYNQQIRTNKS